MFSIRKFFRIRLCSNSRETRLLVILLGISSLIRPTYALIRKISLGKTRLSAIKVVVGLIAPAAPQPQYILAIPACQFKLLRLVFL